MKTPIIYLLALLCCVFSCSFDFQTLEYDKAQKYLALKKFDKAAKHFERAMKSNADGKLALDSAEQAARIFQFHLNNFDSAVRFYRFIVVRSDNSLKRIEAQENIAKIYLEKTMNYKKAVVEYSKLLQINHSILAVTNYRMAITKAYYYMENFGQSEIEVDTLLKLDLGPGHKFQAKLFKANILLTAKKLEEAIVIYKELKSEFSERAYKEKIGLSMAVCYEEMGAFTKAIKVLKEVQATGHQPELIELKIKDLKLENKICQVQKD